MGGSSDDSAEDAALAEEATQKAAEEAQAKKLSEQRIMAIRRGARPGGGLLPGVGGTQQTLG
ncbi:hypothetical protein LCGC14_0432880 [marine sediment metagenome]|uniref:Uncharacterized protein n=1 Tax=marine sediment metagenome TaxID=412755 RepID=A0A0F9VX38_9ZZZZ